MITFTLGGEITVTGCAPEVLEVAKNALSIKNPTYEKVIRMTGNRWAASEFFRYWKNGSEEGSIIIPFGFLSRFTAYLDKKEIGYTTVDNTVDRENSLWIPQAVELRDYQKQIVSDMVDAVRGGTVIAGTGAGKTFCVLESIRRQGRTALIIVPNCIIQKQFVTTGESLGVSIGEVGDGKREIKGTTVCTWQSLLASSELVDELRASISHVYIDECHLAVSYKRQAIIGKLNPSKIYGLTGSARRSTDDGRTDAIFYLCGPVIHKYEVTQLQPTVKTVRTGIDIPVLAYGEMIELMVENEERNKLISGIVMGEAGSGKKVLVLTKRIRHAELLMEKFVGWETAYHIRSDDKERFSLLDELSTEERPFSVLFGTVSLLATGLNIPSLDVVVFASDMKSDVLVQQGAGRILRLFDGKPEPIIYDIYDDKNPILLRQYWVRKNFYERIGWVIE